MLYAIGLYRREPPVPSINTKLVPKIEFFDFQARSSSDASAHCHSARFAPYMRSKTNWPLTVRCQRESWHFHRPIPLSLSSMVDELTSYLRARYPRESRQIGKLLASLPSDRAGIRRTAAPRLQSRSSASSGNMCAELQLRD